MSNREKFLSDLREAVRGLVNVHSMEAMYGNTHDFIVADYVVHCLKSFEMVMDKREQHSMQSSLQLEEKYDKAGQLIAQPAFHLPQTKPRFPCVEATYEFMVDKFWVRIWRNAPTTGDAMAMEHEDIRDFVRRNEHIWHESTLAEAIATEINGISAVQVSRSFDPGDPVASACSKGVVIYTEWP